MSETKANSLASGSTLPEGPLSPEAPGSALVFPFPEVPNRTPRTLLSVDVVLDAELQVTVLARALAAAGLFMINTDDGRLCITDRPWEWRS